MQNTGTLSAHHKNVTRSCKNYAKNLPSNTNFRAIQHRKLQLLSESDESTNSHDEQLSLFCHNKFIKCRRRKTWIANSWSLLVLICVIVNLELVIGAVNSNSVLNSSSNVNNNNINDNRNNRNNKYNVHNDNPTNYTRTLLDEIDDDIALFLDNGIEDFVNLTTTTSSPRPRVIYQNEFAVHIFGGIDVANEIARKHGFTNMGQVSLLILYCLFYLRFM